MVATGAMVRGSEEDTYLAAASCAACHSRLLAPPLPWSGGVGWEEERRSSRLEERDGKRSGRGVFVKAGRAYAEES